MAVSIPTKQSDSNAWINFHKRMRATFSRKKADLLWLEAWEKRGNDYANNENLREYLKSKGIDLEADLADKLANPLGLSDMIGDLAQGAKIAAFALGAIILVFLAMLAINPYKTINTAAQFTPMGKLNALSKMAK